MPHHIQLMEHKIIQTSVGKSDYGQLGAVKLYFSLRENLPKNLTGMSCPVYNKNQYQYKCGHRFADDFFANKFRTKNKFKLNSFFGKMFPDKIVFH